MASVTIRHTGQGIRCAVVFAADPAHAADLPLDAVSALFADAVVCLVRDAREGQVNVECQDADPTRLRAGIGAVAVLQRS